MAKDCYKTEPTELSDGNDYGTFNHIMVTQNENDPNATPHIPNLISRMPRGWLNSAPGRIRYDIRYGNVEDSKKFILLQLEEKVIKSKILSDDYQVTFYKVQTQDPYSNEEKFMQFWVNKEWVEPLTKTDYIKDLKKKLLREMQEEEENKET
jgi:hypothetical protein